MKKLYKLWVFKRQEINRASNAKCLLLGELQILCSPTAGLGKSCPEPDPTHRIEFSVNRDDFEVVFGVLGVDGKCAREIEAYVGLLEKHVSNLGEKWNCMTLLATCAGMV